MLNGHRRVSYLSYSGGWLPATATRPTRCAALQLLFSRSKNNIRKEEKLYNNIVLREFLGMLNTEQSIGFVMFGFYINCDWRTLETRLKTLEEVAAFHFNGFRIEGAWIDCGERLWILKHFRGILERENKFKQNKTKQLICLLGRIGSIWTKQWFKLFLECTTRFHKRAH